MTIIIPDDIAERLSKEASALNTTVEECLADILGKSLAPQKNFDKGYIQQGLQNIKALLTKIPCIQFVSTSEIGTPFWWLKFSIDINSQIAWTVVQELGQILNYLSIEE